MLIQKAAQRLCTSRSGRSRVLVVDKLDEGPPQGHECLHQGEENSTTDYASNKATSVEFAGPTDVAQSCQIRTMVGAQRKEVLSKGECAGGRHTRCDLTHHLTLKSCTISSIITSKACIIYICNNDICAYIVKCAYVKQYTNTRTLHFSWSFSRYGTFCTTSTGTTSGGIGACSTNITIPAAVDTVCRSLPSNTTDCKYHCVVLWLKCKNEFQCRPECYS